MRDAACPLSTKGGGADVVRLLRQEGVDVLSTGEHTVTPPAARRPREKKKGARPKRSRRADARARAQVRVVVHLHITDEDVKRAVAAFGNVAAAPEEVGAPRKKQRADY